MSQASTYRYKLRIIYVPLGRFSFQLETLKLFNIAAIIIRIIERVQKIYGG